MSRTGLRSATLLKLMYPPILLLTPPAPPPGRATIHRARHQTQVKSFPLLAAVRCPGREKDKIVNLVEKGWVKGLTLLETFLVKSVPTLFTEHKWSLSYTMHSIVTDGTVVVRTWDTFVRTGVFGHASRRGFANRTSMCLADVGMSNWIRCKRGLSKNRFEFAGK